MQELTQAKTRLLTMGATDLPATQLHLIIRELVETVELHSQKIQAMQNQLDSHQFQINSLLNGGNTGSDPEEPIDPPAKFPPRNGKTR